MLNPNRRPALSAPPPPPPPPRNRGGKMTPRAAARAAAHSATTATTLRYAALALLLAAILLAGGTLAGPRPSSADGTLTADSVAITSSAASGSDYHAGETLIATVTFSGPITSHTGASLAIAIGANTRTVTLDDVASGLNTTTLDFPYVVTSVDEDTNGVTVAASGALAGTYGHAGHTSPDHTITAITAGLTAQSANTVNSTDTIDYDTDDDRLIEVDSLAKLDAIRYNLNGDGNPTGADADAHNDAFPTPMAYHGCPDTDDADSDPNPCLGYELTANLDFDYNDNGSTHTGGVIDSGDAVAATAAYFDSTTGWNPIGGHANTGGTFSGAFEGNNHTIANLYINLNTSSNDDGRNVGLFGKTTGTIRNLGLVNPYLKNTRSGDGSFIYYGALAGVVDSGSAAVSNAYVSGGQVTGGQTNTGTNLNYAGCLVGRNEGTVSDSYATCDAAAVGGAWGTAGGLVGSVVGTVLRSYATGTVTSDYDAGGLVGVAGAFSGQIGRISDSYATGAVSTATGRHIGGLAGRLSAGADVIDSYATGAVSSSGNGTASDTLDVGGLVGVMTGIGTTVTGSYATGEVSTTGNYNSMGGLAGNMESGAIVASSYATGAVSAADAAGSNNNLGGLVGRTDSNAASILASYATGAVSTSGGSNNNLGGLVGYTRPENTNVRATYASGAVSTSGGSSNNLGGLVGHIEIGTSYARITASYSISAVSASGGSGNNLGGLVGSATTAGTGVFTNTYWDTQATGQTGSANLAGDTPYTTAQLRNPIEYGTSPSIYENWNVDADGQTGNDDPWDFGTSSQYPILKFGHNALSIAEQRAPQRTTVDYDSDNDNLIDITTLSQLNVIRYDLDGDGLNTGDDAVNYYAAFSGITQGMGCPAACIGYELMDDLDFDTDGDGTHTAGAIDTDDAAAYFDMRHRLDAHRRPHRHGRLLHCHL